MAGTIMHLVIADRLLEALSIRNPGFFYCGNLAPDAIMNRKNYTREMKRHTHFKDDIRLHEFHQPEKFQMYLERLNAFYDRFVARPYDNAHWEIYFGYFTHMLVDELYLLHFRDRFVECLLAAGKDPVDKEFWDAFTKDVDMVDLELVRTYQFHYAMPDAIRIQEHYEIEGLVAEQELLDSKDFIIRKNFDPDKKLQPLQVMTMEKNLEFIELAVREIPEILRTRYGMKVQ